MIPTPAVERNSNGRMACAASPAKNVRAMSECALKLRCGGITGPRVIQNVVNASLEILAWTEATPVAAIGCVMEATSAMRNGDHRCVHAAPGLLFAAPDRMLQPQPPSYSRAIPPTTPNVLELLATKDLFADFAEFKATMPNVLALGAADQSVSRNHVSAVRKRAM